MSTWAEVAEGPWTHRARGLALYRGLAFVGLSKIRETAILGGAPIAAHHDQLKCGLGIIELATDNTVATMQFANGVAFPIPPSPTNLRRSHCAHVLQESTTRTRSAQASVPGSR